MIRNYTMEVGGHQIGPNFVAHSLREAKQIAAIYLKTHHTQEYSDFFCAFLRLSDRTVVASLSLRKALQTTIPGTEERNDNGI